jgi:hypothetical protein
MMYTMGRWVIGVGVLGFGAAVACCKCSHIHTYIHTHTQIHTYIHTYIHIMT